MDFTCPVCLDIVGNTKGHRECVLQLFKENKISSIAQWKSACYRKRTVTIKLEPDMNLCTGKESSVQILPTHSSVGIEIQSR
jgi:hypothetical protein